MKICDFIGMDLAKYGEMCAVNDEGRNEEFGEGDRCNGVLFFPIEECSEGLMLAWSVNYSPIEWLNPPPPERSVPPYCISPHP
jgi:hypothetical protein